MEKKVGGMKGHGKSGNTASNRASCQHASMPPRFDKTWIKGGGYTE